MKVISNPYSNAYIDRFNQKIREYNAQKLLPMKLFLLEEINFMHMRIKNLSIDLNKEEAEAYQSIHEFSGVGLELRRCGLPTANEQLADEFLVEKTRSARKFPTPKEWAVSTKVKELKHIDDEMTVLIQMRSALPSPLPQQEVKDYLNKLYSLRQMVLTELSDLDSKDTKAIYHLRTVLSLLNRAVYKDIFKPLKMKQTATIKVIDSFLYQQLIQLTPDEKNELIAILKNPTLDLDKPALFALLPSLEEYNIDLLSKGNNTIWKIVNQETGINLVFQIGLPATNQAIMHQLNNSVSSHSFSTSFFSSSVSLEQPYQLVLTNLYAGDLRNEREQSEGLSGDELMATAASKLDELVSYCQDLSRSQVAHTDIKLTNFLTHPQTGHIVVTDKKGLTSFDKDGNLPKIIESTLFYGPPEWSQKAARESKKINAEKFTTYQLGVALYEYLILPSNPTTARMILDFSNPIFDETDKGRQMQALITEMTAFEPQNRPTLDQVQKRLHALYPQSALLKEEKQTDTQQFRAKLQEGREDYKEKILKRFETLIDGVSSLAELKKLRANIEASSDYALLADIRGWTSPKSIGKIHNKFQEKEKLLSTPNVRPS